MYLEALVGAVLDFFMEDLRPCIKTQMYECIKGEHEHCTDKSSLTFI